MAEVLGYMENKAVPAFMDFTFWWGKQIKSNKQTHPLQSFTLWWEIWKDWMEAERERALWERSLIDG